MASIGYDEAYAAAKVVQIDGQLVDAKAEVKRLTELRKQYAPVKTEATD